MVQRMRTPCARFAATRRHQRRSCLVLRPCSLEPTPWHLVGIAITLGLVYAIIALAKHRMVYATMGLMMLFASIGVAEDADGRILTTWLSHLQQNRNYLFLGAGLLAWISVIGHITKWQGRRLPWQCLLLVAMPFYGGFMRLFHDGYVAMTESLVLAAATVIPLLLIVVSMLREREDWLRLLRSIAVINFLWIGAVFIQIFVFDINAMRLGGDGRFTGFTTNPQHAAAMLAMMGTAVAYLTLYDTRTSFRLIWIAVVASDIVLIGWSGSRTGAGMMLIGFAAVTYARIGRTAIYLPLVLVALYGILHVITLLGINVGFERFFSTANTRAQAWNDLLQGGVSSPLIGVGMGGEVRFSENSYLYAFSSYGILMLVLTVLFAIAAVTACLRLRRYRASTDAQGKALIDTLCGIQAMFVIGAFFEGYMMARVGFPNTMMMAIAAATGMLPQLFLREAEDAEYDASLVYDEQTGEYYDPADLADPDHDLDLDQGGYTFEPAR